MLIAVISSALACSPPPTSQAETAPPPAPPIVVPEGFVSAVYAREPLVADVVAFEIDPRGKIYVAESERQERGIEDNRSSKFWLMDDLAAQTVADRLAYYEKWKEKRLGGMDYYRAFADRIRLIDDTDGDGIGDRVSPFSRDFREPLDGTGAGVMVDGEDVYYTCIPNLWKLRDTNADGVADVTESIFDGFGVRTALRGHDMHGLTIGIDGLIYWSIGDRGYSVTTKEGKILADPKSGAVFRCRPDGSQLEVFATGLRNPQELAFNEFHDLFTGDNNSDGGDKARFVYVMEGGETGWDMNYQTLEGANQRGPWNQEKIWHVRTGPDEAYPAWSLPPLAHVGSGPSGLAYAPGTGMPPKWDRRFFMCDFLGSETHSGVLSIRAEMDGAGYKVVDVAPFVEDVLATDVAFGPDGRVYISAWGGGWYSTGKGSLHAVWDPTLRDAPESKRVREILAEGFDQRPVSELIELLAHADARVRRGAQFALASMGSLSTLQLLALAQAGESGETTDRLRQFAQIHAIWALQMQAVGVRSSVVSSPDPLAPIVSLLESDDAEVRVQAARALSQARYAPALPKLAEHVLDESVRVRAACAIACAKFGPQQLGSPLDAVPAICAALWENDTNDAFLRHALVMGLAGCATPERLEQLSADQFPSVRLGVLLAMRQLRDPAIQRFLFDPDFRIATEAARAIWDVPIAGGFEALAAACGRLSKASETSAATPSAPAPFQFLREVWKEQKVQSSEALEKSPVFDQPADERADVGEASGFSAYGNDYVQRLSGIITAPTDGAYQFSITSDDHSVLSIEEVGVPKSKQFIARVDGYTDPTAWDSEPSQVSAPIQLRAGAKYKIEARHAQGGGGNHLAIGWRLPSGEFVRPIGRVEIDPNTLAFSRRAIAANLQLGGDGAKAIASIAANSGMPKAIRTEALAALNEYQAPAPRDRVHGRVGGMPAPRDTESLRRTLATVVPLLAVDRDGDIRTAALKLATETGIALDQSANLEAVLDTTRSAPERIASLGQLAAAKHESLAKAIDASLVSSDPDLRISARQYLASLDPGRSLKEASAAITNGSEREQQAGVQLLGILAKSPHSPTRGDANQALATMLSQLDKDTIAAHIRLDLIESALASGSEHDARLAAAITPAAGTSLTDALAPRVLQGGDAAIGKEILKYHSAAACLRCHAIAGVGGHAGPALDGVGARLDRRALLQSLVDPQAIVAEGFGSVSAMPPMEPLLKPREIRDLIAYLASLK